MAELQETKKKLMVATLASEVGLDSRHESRYSACHAAVDVKFRSSTSFMGASSEDGRELGKVLQAVDDLSCLLMPLDEQIFDPGGGGGGGGLIIADLCLMLKPYGWMLLSARKVGSLEETRADLISKRLVFEYFGFKDQGLDINCSRKGINSRTHSEFIGVNGSGYALRKANEIDFKRGSFDRPSASVINLGDCFAVVINLLVDIDLKSIKSGKSFDHGGGDERYWNELLWKGSLDFSDGVVMEKLQNFMKQDALFSFLSLNGDSRLIAGVGIQQTTAWS